MRIHPLDGTDLAATLLVAGASTVYAAGLAGANIPALEGVRARSCVVFLFGVLACGVGARQDAFRGSGRFTAALSVIGVLTLIAGIVAVVLGSADVLTALMVGIGALWLGTTVRHLVTADAAVVPHVEHRELVKR